MSDSAQTEPTFRMEILFGHIEIVTTERREGNKLILGGYAIHYDRDGKETHRTEDTPNIICTLPDDMCERRPWWRFW